LSPETDGTLTLPRQPADIALVWRDVLRRNWVYILQPDIPIVVCFVLVLRIFVYRLVSHAPRLRPFSKIFKLVDQNAHIDVQRHRLPQVPQLAREIRDGYAQLIERADRFNDKLNRKNNFFRLDPALAKDQRAYAKYRELDGRLDKGLNAA
jgi:hypothetical protein